MKKGKKLCLFLLCTLLAVLFLPGLAGAADSDFEITDGVLTRYTGSGGDVVIPEGVTSIGDFAFDGCNNLTSVVIPEGVTSIGNYAFSYCRNLISVTLPSTLKSLGENIFNGCDNLTSIEDKSGKFLKTVDGIVYSADGTKIIAVLTSAVGEVRIAEGVTKIPGWMFDANSRVTSVIVPEGVIEIGDYAFRECTNLTSVTLPSTLKTLRDCVFQECPNLASIEDKSGKILKIADGIVYSADGTKLIAVLTSAVGEVRIAEGVTQIPGWLFDSNSRVTSIVVPEGVTEIGYYAFRGCTGLTSVTLPSTLETLRDGVFIECTNLASIEDRSGKFLKVVDGLVYSMDGTQLIAVLASVSGEVRIAEGVTEIPDRLFSKNLRVTSVVVPEGVTSIWFEAFHECTNLTSITLPSTLETIEEGAIPLSTVIRSEPGVYAHTWALENGYTWQSTQQTADPDFEITDGVLTKYTGAGGDVVIPEGVTSIGDQAFYSCAGLTSVVIPEGVTSIGSSAFRYCCNLTSVTLPSTVKTFGQFVFSGCEKLSSIEDQSGKSVKILDGVVYNADGTELVAVLTSAAGELRIAEGVTEIPANLFQGNRLITSVIFPEGLTTISDFAFNCCTNLQTVQLPESLTTIGQFAFANCDHLSQVTLPGGLQMLGSYAFSSTGLRSVTVSEGITKIGGCTFSYCSKLQTVQLPESLTVIESSAFSSCTNLSQITLPEGLQVLDSYAFAYSGLRSVTLPGGLTSVGNCVFASCPRLTSVTLKGMSGILPGGMFSGCTKLQEVNGEDVKTIDGVVYTADGFGLVAALCTASGSIQLEQGIALIPYGFFQGNEQITEVVIPAGVSHIEMSAFMSCSNLTSVTLPESVTHIGVDAFSYCEKLTSINLPEGLVSVGEMAFTGCTSLRSITLPSTLTYLGAGAFDGCTGLEEIQDLSGTLCKTENGIVYSADGTRIISILSTCTGDVQIADGVKVIEAAAFAGHNGITSIVLPESVEQVLGEAFARCSALQSVVLPENLDFVGERLFTNCSSLTSVRLPSNLERLPESTFEGCKKLTDISLPASLKTIGMYAFWDCESLREITLPEGLQTIEMGAFLDCTGLTSATLPASLESLQTGVFGGCTGLQDLQDLSGKFLKTIDGIVYSADQTKIVAVLASISGNVEFAEGIMEIPMGLFDGNTRITGVIIPEGVTRLDWLSFRNCVNLETVRLPESLEIIEASAFEGCQNLTGITLPANLQYIVMEAFAECRRLSSITLPAGLRSIEPGALRNCTGLVELQDLSGRFYQTVDGIVYSVDGTEAVLALAIVSGDVSIMEGVMNIAPYALAGRENITSVILPNSVTGIGLAAIPNGIVIRSDPEAYARTWALENGYTWQCAQHTEVVLEPAVPATRKHTGLTARIQCSVCGAMLSEPEEVPVFDGKVMKLPDNLMSVQRETFLNSTAECFVLPDGCLAIGERAFADCKELKLVEIPASVIAIADTAFEGCGEGLVIVTPKGSAAESFAQTHGITVTSDEP